MLVVQQLAREYEATAGRLARTIERGVNSLGDAAKGKDVRIGGGVSVVRQYLQARLIDEAHFAIAPAFLGSGEHLFGGLDLPALGYDAVEHAGAESALHVVLAKRR